MTKASHLGKVELLEPNPLRRTLAAHGERGEMRFILQRIARGLYVEREDIPRAGLQSVQSLRFSNADDFRQWCDADTVRFEHPSLHIDLKRQADELWEVEAASPNDTGGIFGR